jgi:5'-nucleotidase
MRVLVTNDDGYRSQGIGVLASAVAARGHEVLIACPRTDQSGCGAAIGQWHVDEHIDVEWLELETAPGVRAVAVDGPPALAVFAAHLGGFGEAPDLVVSGINPGANTGRATLHSGTVGAALTAANLGMSGLAVSLAFGDPMHWDTAAALAMGALDWLEGAPPTTVLNLNVPNTHLDQIRGVRWASLAPFGTVRAAVAESEGGRLQMELRAHDEALPAGSDTALVQDGFAALSSLVGIRLGEHVPVAELIEQRILRRSA